MAKKPALEEKLNKAEKDNKSLQDEVARQNQRIEELSARLNWYEEQFRLSKQKQSGSSSEKTDNKRRLFDEAEVESDPKAEEPTVEEITYKWSAIG